MIMRKTLDRRPKARWTQVKLGAKAARRGQRRPFAAEITHVSTFGVRALFACRMNPGDRISLDLTDPGTKGIKFPVLANRVRLLSGRSRFFATADLAFSDNQGLVLLEKLTRMAEEKEKTAESKATRQVNLPFKQAVAISFRSMKIRFWRSFVTSAVIFLAIAFLVYMLSIDDVSSRLEVGEVITKIAKSQRIWVALMSIIVATVGITNTLHMSVAERYREIGTMKCLGALDRFVVELFMLEALTLGAVGSLAGSLLGTLLSIVPWLMRTKELTAVTLPWGSLGTNFLIGIGVGIFLTILGALYPAVRAARMAPAEAMRTEV